MGLSRRLALVDSRAAYAIHHSFARMISTMSRDGDGVKVTILGMSLTYRNGFMGSMVYGSFAV
jgi:hypothetical protein